MFNILNKFYNNSLISKRYFTLLINKKIIKKIFLLVLIAVSLVQQKG